MARIRTIKPAFWSSGDIHRLTRDARLLYIGLWNFADDEGRFLASLNRINGDVFPLDDIPNSRVKRWFDELVAGGQLHLYEVDGVAYAHIPTWEAHQKINRAYPSQLPEPTCCTSLSEE